MREVISSMWFKFSASLFLAIVGLLDLAANPSEHSNPQGESTGWLYPLDDLLDKNDEISPPSKNITNGFMTAYEEGSNKSKFHYAQDITRTPDSASRYSEGASVYSVSDGEVFKLDKIDGYEGAEDDDFNILVLRHEYSGSEPESYVYVLYGHVSNKRVVDGVIDAHGEVKWTPGTHVSGGQIIGYLNNYSPSHLHISVFRDKLPADYFKGYTDSQTTNGRHRAYDASITHAANQKESDWKDSDASINQSIETDLVFFDEFKPIGGCRSLPIKQASIKKALNGSLPLSRVTFEAVGMEDDFYRIEFNRGAEQTGEHGGQCVVFVQKMRPELTFGWGDAANGPKRAREEGFEVNSLPRVGAAFIDPARPGNRYGHTGIVTSVTKDQVNGRDYYRLLIDDSNAATYEKVRRDVLMWLRIEQDGTVVFDPSVQRDSDAYTLYGLGENNASGPERALLFIHEKVEEYNQKRAQLADYYHLNNDAQLDQVMALRRNLVFYLVDRSGSMKGQGGSLDLRDEVRDRIFAHAAQQGSNTKVELQFFNSNAGSVADWHPFDAGNLNQFKAHFNQQFNPDGGTRLFDTVYEVTEHLRAQGADYNQIQLVIFSDGEDNESSARGQAERWKVISPSLAQLRVSNHFVRAYLFTMGYEISAQDATTLKEIGVEVTAVAVEAAQQNLKHLDRVRLKEGTQFNGKLLGKDIQFDKMLGRTRVALKDLIAYGNGAIRTKDGVSQEVESAQGSMDMDTGESTISIKMENVSSIIMAE